MANKSLLLIKSFILLLTIGLRNDELGRRGCKLKAIQCITLPMNIDLKHV